MTLSHDRFGGVLILFFCCAYGWLALDIPSTSQQIGSAFTARTMPIALTSVGVILSLWLILFPKHNPASADIKLNWIPGLCFLILMSGYGLSIRPLGFILATGFFLALGFALLGERKPVLLGVLPTVIATTFWLLLSKLLGVYVAPWPAIWTQG